MPRMPEAVCLLGHHEPDYPRNRSTCEALMEAGYIVLEVHSRAPLPWRHFSLGFGCLKIHRRVCWAFVTEGDHRLVQFIRLLPGSPAARSFSIRSCRTTIPVSRIGRFTGPADGGRGSAIGRTGFPPIPPIGFSWMLRGIGTISTTVTISTIPTWCFPWAFRKISSIRARADRPSPYPASGPAFQVQFYGSYILL